MPKRSNKIRKSVMISSGAHDALEKMSHEANISFTSLIDKLVGLDDGKEGQAVFNDTLIGDALQSSLVKDLIESNVAGRLPKRYAKASKPDPSIIDAAILACWVHYPKQWVKTRNQVLGAVSLKMEHGYYPDRDTMAPPSDSRYTSWSKVYPAWFKKHKHQSSQFEISFDSRLRMLVKHRILLSAGRGKYQRVRELHTADKDIIYGVNRLSPQRGLKIPALLAPKRLNY